MRNPIQHYAWGTRDTLAQMRGAPVPAPEPEAELWVGAHPKSPSVLVQDGVERSLAEAVEAEPQRFRLIDASRPLPQVLEQVGAVLDEFLAGALRA